MLTPSVSRLAGGVFPALRGLALALHHPPDLDVSIVGLRDPMTDQDRATWNPLPLEVCETRGPRSWGFAGNLVPVLRSAHADLTHIHGLWMYPSLANLIQARRGMPYLISPHGMLDSWALANANWKKRIALSLYEAAHLNGAGCIHALCEAELHAIRAFGLRNPVCVIPNGVDLVEQSDTYGERPDWLKQIPAGSRILLYLGRLHPKKGLDALLSAWSLARQRQSPGASDWHLVIAGWDQGNYRHELEIRAADLKILDSVSFPGPQFGAAKETTYAHAHALVLPSLSEGMPMAVLEAWSAGLPVLMTQECNLPEGFVKGAARRIMPDPLSIADSLAELFALDDKARQDMGGRGRGLIEDRFAWYRVANEMGAVYRWLSGSGAPPACVAFA
jgi:poly(glycerol-phosphate) alpha-glucosyltransferase